MWYYHTDCAHHCTLVQALQEQGSFELLGVVDEQLEAESEEQERHRWAATPQGVSLLCWGA